MSNSKISPELPEFRLFLSHTTHNTQKTATFLLLLRTSIDIYKEFKSYHEQSNSELIALTGFKIALLSLSILSNINWSSAMNVNLVGFILTRSCSYEIEHSFQEIWSKILVSSKTSCVLRENWNCTPFNFSSILSEGVFSTAGKTVTSKRAKLK